MYNNPIEESKFAFDEIEEIELERIRLNRKMTCNGSSPNTTRQFDQCYSAWMPPHPPNVEVLVRALTAMDSVFAIAAVPDN